MALAREVEKVHIRRGKLHEDGTRDLSLVSKGYGKMDMKSDFNMPTSEIWHWRLTPDYENKINNYPEPPIDKILWQPGEKEARRKARQTPPSAALGKTKKFKNPSEETRELHVSEGVKAARANAPDFPALNS
jgi:hypothetical protein